MVRSFCTYLLLMGMTTSCKSQTTEQKIYKTAAEVVNLVKEGETKKIISLIGVDELLDIGKDEEMVNNDIKKCKDLIAQYLGKEKPVIQITDLYNHLGQRLVKIPLYPTDRNAIPEKEMHLSLKFGPPNFVSLDKISGYDLVKNNSDSLDYRPLSYWRK